MSAHRRIMVLACSAALLSWWGTAWLWPQAWADWPRWPLQALAWVGLVTSVMGSQPQHRRLHFTLALLLLLSTWVLPSLQGAPGSRPIAWPSLGHLSSSLHWSALILGIPFCMITLVNNMHHPVIPGWARVTSKLGIGAWLITMAAYLGSWLTDTVPDSPIIFWGAMLLILPLYFRPLSFRLGLLIWSSCMFGLIASVMSLLVPPQVVCDLAQTISTCLTLVSWIAWYARMEDICRFDALLAGLRAIVPESSSAHEERQNVATDSWQEPSSDAFDLDEHLDSPQAQEGADKYTRE